MRVRRPLVLRLSYRLRDDQRGGTAIEYGLILALVVLTMIASLQLVANATVSMWGNTTNKVAAATGY